MKLGLIGIGTVGGTLKKYFQEKTKHEIVCRDPDKGLNDSFDGVDAAFISVPVPPADDGQDLKLLKEAVSFAQKYTDNVFIRSTVLPGTNDLLGTIACPEFLTERRAFADMCELPILVGRPQKNIPDVEIIKEIFPNKDIIMVSNAEAELAKFTHNCFGAMKVTYFNIIHEACKNIGADYTKVLKAAQITGFIGSEHTQVPGPDGHKGYGGKCFPENIEAFRRYLHKKDNKAFDFFSAIETLNFQHRDVSI